MDKSIEAADAQKIAFILLRMIERDGEPITIMSHGRPIAILRPAEERTWVDPK